jgi:hypothetical protein
LNLHCSAVAKQCRARSASFHDRDKSTICARPFAAYIDDMAEHRIEQREALALPVQLGDGTAAVTRDISASGMYLEIPGVHQLGGAVVFEMKLAQAQVKFTAEGTIVRIEHHDGSTGVALKLHAHRLEPFS